jgi:hypothetical protein
MAEENPGIIVSPHISSNFCYYHGTACAVVVRDLHIEPSICRSLSVASYQFSVSEKKILLVLFFRMRN